MCACTCITWHPCGGERSTLGSWFFLSTMWVLGIELACQVWWQVSSPTKSSCQSLLPFGASGEPGTYSKPCRINTVIDRAKYLMLHTDPEKPGHIPVGHSPALSSLVCKSPLPSLRSGNPCCFDAAQDTLSLHQSRLRGFCAALGSSAFLQSLGILPFRWLLYTFPKTSTNRYHLHYCFISEIWYSLRPFHS